MNPRIVSQIRALAAAADSEICGALISDGSAIVDAWPLQNQSSHSQVDYLIPATVVLEVEREAQARGLQLSGFYHSHPQGEPVPSQSDVTQAVPGYLYLIVGSEGDVRMWRLRDDREGFDEVAD